ncbi:DEAD-box ATP-dependent RNA helicase 50 [Nymphaea thermarum]|nr:DEAD-box ATP-dependent RNA helicase 50 [Nymphaea thermarum]
MLLAAPPALSFVLPLRLRPLWDDGSGLLQLRRNATSRTAALVVRAEYTRKPTGTPGAYHLFDDNTGERFIVWGAANDNSEDFVVPRKEVLTQNPDVPPNSGGGSLDGVVSIGKVKRIDGFSGSFSRLKVHNVRALIRKSSKKMQKCIGKVNIGYQNALPNVEEDSEHHPIVLVREDKVVMGEGAVDKVNMVTADVKHLYHNQEHGDASFGESSFGSLGSSEKNVEFREPFTPRIHSSLRGWASGRSLGKDETNTLKPSRRSRGLSGGREFFSRKSFKSLGCSESMINALRNLNILRPSHIQALSYLPVLERRTCIIAEQSGSGKTLAYLSPVIQRLQEDEAQGLAKSLPGRPRVVILVPTAELASQVLCICRLISKSGVPFRSMVTTGGFKQKTQVDNLREDVDILIATPGRLMFLLQEGSLQLNNLIVVLDEVDVLFSDNDFEQVFQCLITSGPVAMQYIFVTATLPTDIYNKLIEAFPDSVAIMGPGLHQINSGLEEVLVDCSGDDREEKNPETAFLNKKAALLRLIEDSPASRTIIFCNKIESCRKVENVLHRYDRKGSKLRVLPFHAAVAQESRISNMKEFCSAQSQGSLFLICTDRASRGIDFQKVDHVVLFDFPRDPSEYVRRVGRTARGAGGEGKAFVFVVGKQVSLARRIIERNKKGHPLHDVPSAELFV